MPEPLSPAELEAYLERIGHAEPLAANLTTLTALHRAHVLAIPFENLDVQLGTPPTLDPAAIYAKLVTARRGGWCYEQNGLLARALAAIGFEVTRLAGGVMRQLRGDFSVGSHLALKVRAKGQDWLCDVGFGSSQIDPVPLVEHRWDHGALAGTLSRTGDGWWRFAIEEGPNSLSYDFRDEPADEARLAMLCEWQGRDEESVFVQNLVVQQRTPDGHLMLRGKVLTVTGPGGLEVCELQSGEEMVQLLHSRFALDLPQVAALWDQIEARHAALFG